MAKRTVTDIAREQGVTEAEVKEKLDAAGTASGTDDLIDDDDVRRAFGAKATVPAQEPGQAARPPRPPRVRPQAPRPRPGAGSGRPPAAAPARGHGRPPPLGRDRLAGRPPPGSAPRSRRTAP